MAAEAGLLMLCFCLGCAVFFIEENKRSLGHLISENAVVELQGRVDEVKETAYGITLMLSHVVIVGEKHSSLKLVASASETDGIMPGDRIRAYGMLKEFDRARNPGEFDSYLYYRSLGYQYSCEIKSIAGMRRPRISVYRMLVIVRSRLQSIYRDICTEDASGVYQAMLLGEKSELLTETRELYSDGGISHILAISGLHIAVLGMGLYQALRRVGGFRSSGMLAGLVIGLYVLMTGLAVSAYRAAIMFVIQITSLIVKRSYDMLSAAAAALLFLLWQNPCIFFIVDASFRLAQYLLLGLCILRFLIFFEAERPMTKALLSSLSVSLVTFPILSWSFYELSPYSIVLNLLVIPLMTFVMVSGLLGGISGLFWLDAGKFW